MDGVFEESHKKEHSSRKTKKEKKKKKKARESSTIGELCKAAVSADPQLVMSTAKEALSIEDFRTCIARTPDFRRTFSFQL